MTSGASKEKLGYWSVVAIGVGGMVGGGIFAVLGLAVQMAHGGTPVAFAIAGFVALLTS
jgi:amino acid transporter